MLAQGLLDELVYNEQGNEVVLIKYLDLVPESPESGNVDDAA